MNTITKPKRGQRFIIIDTGEEITLNRVKENGEYFCIFDNGSYESFWPDELKPVKEQRQAIKTKPISDAKKANKASRSDFFKEVAKDMPYNCMNCSKPLYAFTDFAKRCCSSHVLPKSKFPSVEFNKDNILFMGTDIVAGVCNCHSIFDNTVELRVKMNIYPLALERYEKLKPFLSNKELVEANKYLGL